jgi:hypothetical protein
MPVANVVWNKINPWAERDHDLDILDPYSVGTLMLEMECNTQDHSQASIKRQALESLKNKLETAIEIVNDMAPVLEIYLAEEASPYSETPNLYMQDYYGIRSMHIKCLPMSSGNGFVTVSYQSYVAQMDSLNPDSKIPAWSELEDYFVNGGYVYEQTLTN